MRCHGIMVGIAVGLLLATPATAQPPAPTPGSSPASASAAAGSGNPLPIVGVVLDHEKELGLSSAQVEGLERLGLDVVRAMIRRQADLTISWLDVSILVDRDPDEAIDVAKVETRIRETETIRTDSQLVLVRAIEAAKAQLTPEQRAKLTVLLRDAGDGDGASPDPAPGDSSARTGGGRAPGGGAGGRPHGTSHRHFEGHRGVHGHVFIGPLWWGPPYPYWGYPGWAYVPPPAAVEPPVYIQPSPPAPPAYWYYCSSAGAYYPTVQTCPEPWLQVAPRGE